MSRWSDQELIANPVHSRSGDQPKNSPKTQSNVPGSSPRPTLPRTPKAHRHDLSNASSNFQSPNNQRVYRNLDSNSAASTPHSMHSRTQSYTLLDSPRGASNHQRSNYLKLIPPMPTGLPPLSQQQGQQKGHLYGQMLNNHLQNADGNRTHTHDQVNNHNPMSQLRAQPQPQLQPYQQNQRQHEQYHHLPQKSAGYSSTSTTKETPFSSTKNSNLTPLIAVTKPPGSPVCATCGRTITTKSVKALGKRYHTECFSCADCSTPILSKYFPYDAPNGEKLPLCEEHFYKRRGLVCCVCDSFLKGTHYTVFGRKYDTEHFCCKICSKKFETDEDFFNHENDIYCHYHFSKFFIERCEGCEFAILKQYVEIFRGGKNQKWHVECYMIHKCWNTSIKPNSIGTRSFPKIEPTDENIKNSLDIDPTPDELIAMETKASEKINEIWRTLFKFEEDAATCISDMLQYATRNDQEKSLEATAKLVLKIDSLFKSLDSLHRLGIDPDFTGVSLKNLNIQDNNNQFHTLKKEPRNLSAKLMIYLSILRKIGKGVTDASSSQDLILSVVTGLAHYLKLLLRYGLNNSLQYNKASHTTNALDKFLREIRNHEVLPEDPLSSLDVGVDASDLCFHCQKSIESECVQFQDKRWHIDCLQCSHCHKKLQDYGGISDASFNPKKNCVLCAQCAIEDPDAEPGFKSVPKLLQLSYLLKIAIARSKAVMDYETANGINQHRSGDNARDSTLYGQNYLKTLNDIKRLRSTRQNTRISDSTSKESARRSRVYESTELTKDEINQSRNAPGNKFSPDDIIATQKITVEDEPMGPSLSKRSVTRATNFINNQKVLTLDDIPRIVAAEHARELRPNTYKFHNPHREEEGISGVTANKSIKRSSPSVNHGSDQNSNTTTGEVSKYYSQLTDHEMFILSHISVVVLRYYLDKNSVGQEIDVKKLIELKKTATFWEKLKGIAKDDKKVNLTRVFGAELKDLTTKTGVGSSQSNGPSKVKIPLLIDDLLGALYQKDMSIEGIFRKNGNLKTLKELINLIDSNPSKVPPLINENAIQLSALLKKFLRELPNPLLTFKLYEIWILSQKMKDPSTKKILTELSYSLLPKVHRDVAEVLLFFFMWASSFSHLDETNGSKMDIHNLATVLSPNILYAKPSEVARPSKSDGVAANYYEAFGENEGENYYLAIEVVDYLITHNEELGIVPSYLLKIYDLCKFGKLDKGVDLTSKEIFTQIETTLKENPQVLGSVGKKETLTAADTSTNETSIVQEIQQPLETSYEN